MSKDQSITDLKKEELVEILKTDTKKWNKLRKHEPNYRPDLSKADLPKADLSRWPGEGANLKGASLSEANLSGADLSGTDLSKADLSEANLSGADLSGGLLSDETNLSGANLSWANLSGANLSGADLSGANLIGAKLSGADLRYVRDLVLDGNEMKGAIFSSMAKDPWSVLRRKYSGPNMFFSLIFLAIFALPYMAKTMMWIGVNRAQVGLIEVTTDLQDATEQLEDGPGAVLVGQVADKLSRIQPCLENDCSEFKVWQVLIGFDRDWIFWSLAILLLVYNLCRGFLTWRVGPLRDDVDLTGYAPPLKGFHGYGWLIWPHRIVQVLLWVSVFSLAYHGWDWLFNTSVWLPAP